MEVADGATASVQFYNTTYKSCMPEEKQEIREHLLKYCELDTLAEIMIVKELKNLLGKS